MSYLDNYDVKCPYCGHEMELCHDDGAYYSEDYEDCECYKCEETFQVSTYISYTHTAHCADNMHDYVKYEDIWPDSRWSRERDCVGATFYVLRCNREECDEGRHFRTKEEYDKHSAPCRREVIRSK